MYGFPPAPPPPVYPRPRVPGFWDDTSRVTLVVVGAILAGVALVAALLCFRSGLQYAAAEALVSRLHGSAALADQIKAGALRRLVVTGVVTVLFGGGAVTTIALAVRTKR